MATAACTLRFQLPSHLDADSSFFDKKSLSLWVCRVCGLMIEGPHGARTRKFLKAHLSQHSFPLLHTARYMGTCGQIRGLHGSDLRRGPWSHLDCGHSSLSSRPVYWRLSDLPVCHPYRYAIPTMMLHMTACACSGLRRARARIRLIAISSRRRSSVLCQQRAQHLRPSLSLVMPFCTAPA